MQVIWKRLYKAVSFQDAGTLYHLRNTVGRSNVTGSPKDNFNECEDFFFTVVRTHIIAAAMEVLGMDSLSESPKKYIFPDPRDLSSEQRKGLLMTPALEVVTKFFSLGLHSGNCVTVNHLYSAYIHASLIYVLILCIPQQLQLEMASSSTAKKYFHWVCCTWSITMQSKKEMGCAF